MEKQQYKQQRHQARERRRMNIRLTLIIIVMVSSWKDDTATTATTSGSTSHDDPYFGVASKSRVSLFTAAAAAAGASFSEHSSSNFPTSIFNPTKFVTIKYDINHHNAYPSYNKNNNNLWMVSPTTIPEDPASLLAIATSKEATATMTRRSALEESAMAFRNWYLLHESTFAKTKSSHLTNNNRKKQDKTDFWGDDDKGSSDDDSSSSDDDDDSSSSSDSSDSESDDSSSDDDESTFLYFRPILKPLIKKK